jgi:hypothetical protein
MGYFRDSHPGHEGYAVGIVTREDCDPGSGIYRELSYPETAVRPVEFIAAACDCGWRSPRFVPEYGADWSPCTVNTTERDDVRIEELWADHLDHTSEQGFRTGLKRRAG